MFIDEMYYSNDNITIDTSKESCSVLDETSSETYDTTHDLKARNQGLDITCASTRCWGAGNTRYTAGCGACIMIE
jgi:hypothetical protein